jgi:hypothetical protein
MLEELCNRIGNMKIEETNFDISDGKLSSKLKTTITNDKKIKKSMKQAKAFNKEELLKCINLHLKILEISKKVEKYFSIIIMAQGLMTTLFSCATVYSLSIVSI